MESQNPTKMARYGAAAKFPVFRAALHALEEDNEFFLGANNSMILACIIYLIW